MTHKVFCCLSKTCGKTVYFLDRQTTTRVLKDRFVLGGVWIYLSPLWLDTYDPIVVTKWERNTIDTQLRPCDVQLLRWYHISLASTSTWRKDIYKLVMNSVNVVLVRFLFKICFTECLILFDKLDIIQNL